MDRKKKPMAEKDIAELLPVKDYGEDGEGFFYQDGSYMDLLKINTKDLTNANVDEIEMDCFTWAKYYRVSLPDIKFIFQKFPCNTSQQQRYWAKKIKKNRNPLFDAMLKQKHQELVYREKNASTREYYMMIFATSKEELREFWRQIENVLHTGPNGKVSKLSQAKKRQILFKLTNKNSLIFQGEEA